MAIDALNIKLLFYPRIGHLNLIFALRAYKRMAASGSIGGMWYVVE